MCIKPSKAVEFMKLQKGNETIELTNEIQIDAYKRAGYTEAKPPKQKRGDKNGDNEA